MYKTENKNQESMLFKLATHLLRQTAPQMMIVTQTIRPTEAMATMIITENTTHSMINQLHTVDTCIPKTCNSMAHVSGGGWGC